MITVTVPDLSSAAISKSKLNTSPVSKRLISRLSDICFILYVRTLKRKEKVFSFFQSILPLFMKCDVLSGGVQFVVDLEKLAAFKEEIVHVCN